MTYREALLYANLKTYRRTVAKTRQFLRWALAQVQKPYLACSFGKDSSVMLHIALDIQPDIPVRFATHPETNLLDNYEDIVGWWLSKGIHLEEIYCYGDLIKVKHHQRNRLNEGDYDSFLIGIRAQESVARRVSLKTYGQFYKLKTGRVKICPMAWWSEKEVAAYIAEHNLPLLSKYEVEGVSARTTSGIPRTHIHESLTSLKQRDIYAFNQLCKLYPDARHYV